MNIKAKAAHARWKAHPWVPIAPKEVLERMYIEQCMTQAEIGDSQGVADAEPSGRQGREQDWRGTGTALPSDSPMGDAPRICSGTGFREGGSIDHWNSASRAVGLFPPGPADSDTWQLIAECAPHLLPAHARHDRFRVAIGNARAAAYGDPAKRAWLDPKGPYGLRAAIVQEIAQSVLRGMADGLAANRVDWLRLLGNGVVDLAAAYAVRTLATRLAERGSAGAARLVRMMEDDLFS